MLRRQTCGGGALIIVLWLVSLLTVVAMSTLTLTRSEDRAVRRVMDAATAEIAADSAIKLTLLSLSGTSSSTLPAGGRADLSGLAASFAPEISVAVERERGRVDVNTASRRMLAACFAGGGVSDGDADMMAAKVIDWRDDDDVPELGGAEASDYQAAGLDYGPRNRPFQSPEELRRVVGLRNVSDSVLNRFTVYTHETGADSLISAFNDESVDPHARLQCRGALSQRTGTSGVAQDTWAGEIARIRACADGRARLCRVAVVRLTGNRRSPFQIFMWRTEMRWRSTTR